MTSFPLAAISNELFPAFRTRYFFVSGSAAKPPSRKQRNELRQLLQSGLGWQSFLSIFRNVDKSCHIESIMQLTHSVLLRETPLPQFYDLLLESAKLRFANKKIFSAT